MGRHIHGMSGTPTHMAWVGMRQRCLNPSGNRYHRYGGRGIKVCERWLESFENFLADMGESPIGMSLDRIDNDGDYEPNNCRWADDSEQNRNRSIAKIVTAQGITMTLPEWSDKTGIPQHVLRNRLYRDGWDTDRAVSTPVKYKGDNYG